MWLREEEEEKKEDRNRIHAHVAVLLTYSIISCSPLFLLTIQAASSLHDEVNFFFFFTTTRGDGLQFSNSLLRPPAQEPEFDRRAVLQAWLRLRECSLAVGWGEKKNRGGG